MFEIAILILLYNKEISESNTITSLLDSNVQYQNARIVIWNNGPKPMAISDSILLENLGYDVVIKETLNNESLAVIYNKFLAENIAEKYILLDDDSTLNASYILASSEICRGELGMPVINSQGEVQSPKINGLPYSKEAEISLKSKVAAVGSGLIIGSEVIAKLKEKYNLIFDERFYLYGVDITFCLRVFDCELTDRIRVISGFNHSLSRLEKESPKMSKFRRLERSYDLGLRQRYYYPLSRSLFVILKVSFRTLKMRFFRQEYRVYLLPLFKAFVLGKHYRSGR